VQRVIIAIVGGRRGGLGCLRLQLRPLRPQCDDSDDTNQKGGMEQDWMSYPQVDNPPGEQTRRWKDIARATAAELNGYADPIYGEEKSYQLFALAVAAGGWGQRA